MRSSTFEYLAAKQIRLLGMDTPAPDQAWYEVHQILLGSEIVVVESPSNLDQVPDSFTFVDFR
jgi:kynurenine formamidase